MISSPTGSGKSHLILKTLLPQAIKEGKHILYLCSRKILNEQIQVDAKSQLSEFFGDCPNISEEHLHAIHIVTYQYCETTSRFPRLPISLSEASKMDLTPENTLFYVFDEAHYFSCDALFNSGTCFWVNKIPTKGINIFLTATPAPLLFFLAACHPKFRFEDQLPLLSNREKNKAIADIFKSQNTALIHHVPLKFDPKSFNETQRYVAGKNDIFEEYEYSKTAFIGILYEMSDYMAALENYKNPNDSCFYLKCQLSWIGKEYDEKNWINYEERMNSLLEYLAAQSGVWMNKDAQQTFSAECLNLLLNLPVPPKSLKQNASRYSIAEGKLPGLKVLRQAFHEKKIPYVIQAKQKYMPTKTTCWCVTEAACHIKTD